MSLRDAIEYEPTKSTYALRIFPAWGNFRKPLRESSLYKVIHKYVFDAISPPFFNSSSMSSNYVLFTPDLADKIISDFSVGKQGCESLLVNCTQGINRSPAVALALNEIFDLGYDSEVLKNKHPKYTKYVYDTLMKAATRGVGR